MELLSVNSVNINYSDMYNGSVVLLRTKRYAENVLLNFLSFFLMMMMMMMIMMMLKVAGQNVSRQLFNNVQ